MSKRRGPKKVKEIASEMGLSVSAILSMLKDLGYDVRSAQSKVNKQMEDALKQKLIQERAASASSLKRKKKIYGQNKEAEPEEKKSRPRVRRSFQKGRYSGEKRRARKKQKESERIRRASIKSGEPGVLRIPGSLSVGELSSMLGQPSGEVILKLMSMDVMATVNQTIDPETVELVAGEFGYQVEFVEPEVIPEKKHEEDFSESRPPVVAVLGHVDHGKTTLLDYIRRTSVAQSEHGGITQHMGAYRTEHDGYTITFLDTPGHAAFTTIRARGAQGADIVVLVVAANEGVQEQTKEAIAHARVAGCPIIVALSKIDLPNADPDKVKRELAQENLIPEDWGGDTIVVPISGKTGQGVDVLLDSILVKAEELNLKSTTKGPAEAVVLESRLEKGRGPVATVLVQRGILRLGVPFVVGTVPGKVRALYNEWGKRVKKAKPSDPVVIQGLSDLPKAGDILREVSDEKESRAIAAERSAAKRDALIKGEMALLSQRIQEKASAGDQGELFLVVKADTQGSLEAVSDTVGNLSDEDVKVEIVMGGVGVVTEADVALAHTVGGMVVAFGTSVDAAARAKSKETGVPIRSYNVIYELLDDISRIASGLVEPTLVEKQLGKARVLKVFRVAGGRVAGCVVDEGTAARDARVRVLRGDEKLWEGKVMTLRRFQDDVNEVKEGDECGVRLAGFDKFQENDVLEFFKLEEAERKSQHDSSGS